MISPGWHSGRRSGWRSWWWDGLLLVALAVTTGLAAIGVTDDLDLAIRSWCMDHDPTWARGPAVVLNHFGQGWVLMYVFTIPLTLAALVRTRKWQVVLPGLAAYLLAGFGAGPLKIWSERDAPSSKQFPPDVAVQFFNSAADYDRSFPSGHVVNTFVWWPAILTLLAIALARPVPTRIRRFLLAGPPAIVFVTTIFLSYHWLTDDIAAVFLGLFLARLYFRIPWDRIFPR
ncbi:MAG: phosphatase PAP2 family protein [Hamadaea sp.]|uniref:phosphatase PAP2 family protein n=1 Tax=Hamadaea sp. TaxID=2024425 RepID=UPI0017B6EB77|nr:phosphatase PAP2 family protein [Hamadaea sp.]NUR73057.1 phosphatase PAP2 family protein [Hamadaea sp.]NUT20381.1 phosphatase PAP2 family protein [Hamadaea sp.]